MLKRMIGLALALVMMLSAVPFASAASATLTATGMGSSSVTFSGSKVTGSKFKSDTVGIYEVTVFAENDPATTSDDVTVVEEIVVKKRTGGIITISGDSEAWPGGSVRLEAEYSNPENRLGINWSGSVSPKNADSVVYTVPDDAAGTDTVFVTVKYTDGDVSASHTIRVLEPAGADFAVSGPSEAEVGENVTFSTTGENDSKVTFSVLEEGASINGNGRFKATEAGTYTVVATAINGGSIAEVTDETSITVTGPVCAHKKVAVNFTSDQHKTHMVEICCEDCGTELFSGTEDCADEDKNGICDRCYGDLLCRHSQANIYYLSNGDGTHQIAAICVECLQTVFSECMDCTDVFTNGVCDLCDGLMPAVIKFSISGTTVNLESELEIGFAFQKSDIPADVDLTATVTQISGGEVVNTYTFPKTKWMSYKENYYALAVKLPAVCMADEFSVAITDADGNVWNTPHSDSYRAWATRALDKSSNSTKMKTMMVDMLNYGAAAQTYFRYNAADLANKDLSAEQRAMTTGDVSLPNMQVKGMNNAGTTVELESRILVNSVFDGISDPTGMTAVATFVNCKGETKTKHFTDKDFILYQGRYYKLTLDNMAPGDIRSNYTVTVYNADGTVYGTATDGLGGYLSRAMQSNPGNAMFRAAATFGMAVRNYYCGSDGNGRFELPFY